MKILKVALSRSTWQALMWSACTVALFLLSVPGYGDCGIAGFIGLMPLYVALQKQTASRSFLIGWGTGALLIFLATIWMIPSTQFVAGYSKIASAGILVLVSLYQGLQLAAASWLFWIGKKWLPAWLSFSLAFGVADALFPHFYAASHCLFLKDYPGLLQTADIAGHGTITLLIAIINSSVVDAFAVLKAKNWKKITVAVIPAICSAVLIIVYGGIRISMVDEQMLAAEKIRVAVIQPGVFPTEAQEQNEALIQTHVKMSKAVVAKENIDLLVWSESLFQHAMSQADLRHQLKTLLADISVPVLLGAPIKNKGNFSHYTNSVILAAPDGWICPDCRYDKTILFPIGERMVSDRNREQEAVVDEGTYLNPIPFNNHFIAAYICFESLFPAHVRKLARSSALLVNPSYDGWFLQTKASHFHEALGRIRAIENRKVLIRAALSGISTIVDPVGRTVQRAEVGEKATITSTVAFMSSPTIFSFVGKWPWYAILFLILFGYLPGTLMKPAKCHW